MTGRARSLSVAVIAVIAVVAVATYLLQTAGPNFTLLLRCDEGIDGTIAVKSEERTTAQMDLASACRAGSTEFDEYDQGEDLVVAIALDGADSIELKLIYGEDIQTAPNGYFAVVKVTAAAPFIASDRL